MKRCLSIFLSLSLIFSIFTVSDFSAFADNTNGNFSYSVNDSGVTITRCNDYNSTEIIIPSKIDGYPVTEIDQYAFEYCRNLTSIHIPSSVTHIWSYAFCYEDSNGYNIQLIKKLYIDDLLSWNNCHRACYTGLNTPHDLYLNGALVTDLIIPDSVTSIGDYAFSGCTGLTSVTIPNGVTSIGSYVFSDCTGLTSVTIPDSVTSIGGSAFSGCTGLTSVTIPNNVTSIDHTFSGCTSLTSVTIPNSVTSIDGAFSGCTSLTSVTIPNSVTGIGDYAFSGCTGLTSVTIPNSVTGIGDYAFSGCTGLTSVKIPDSVTKISEHAFEDCNSLTSVTIPDSVTNMGNEAFSDCTGLTSVTISDGVTNIGWSAFSGCTGLTSVKIPDSVTSIGSYAFSGCTGLTSVTIPDSVTNMGYCAFGGCTGLTSVTISDGVTSIGDSAFRGCTGLTSVTIPNSVTSIGDSAFRGCTGLTSVKIPDSVTSIGSSAFYGCTGLTSVTIPDSVTSIGSSAFSGCTGLTSVTIPNSVKSIGGSAFYGCKNLKNVSIPDGVKTIGDNAFYDCRKFTEITLPKSVKSVGSGAFWNCINLNKVKVLNPDCSISVKLSSNTMPFPKCATIYGYSGSTAEVFAKNNGYNFLDMTKNCYHHSYKLTESKPSTCTRSGYKKYTCTVCNDSYTESLPLVPHRYENKKKKAGIGTNGYVSDECTVCGDVESKSVIYGVNSITLGSTTCSYTGKSQKPSVTVKDSKGKTVPTSSYTVSYSKDTKSVGKHSVKITLKGNYTGSKTLYYTVIPKNTSLSKLTAGKKSFTVTLKKYTTQTTGYQIQYSTSSNFKGAKTVTLSNKMTAKKVKGLKSKKKYYVRVRTYKTVDGKKYCSKWSKAKTVKTK